MLKKASRGQKVWFTSVGDEEAMFGVITGLKHKDEYFNNYRRIGNPKPTDEVEITGDESTEDLDMEYVYATRGEVIDAMIDAARARINREGKFIDHLVAQAKLTKSRKTIERPPEPSHKFRCQWSTS